MTLRDFLKANGALIKFKKLYHERSKTKITYRQIETNLLTAGEDFIKKALNLNGTHYDYWLSLNTKWNGCYIANEAKSKSSSTDKTLGSWLKIKGIEENFRKAFLNQYPHDTVRLNEMLKSIYHTTISTAFTWARTSEGYDFWHQKSGEWRKFCTNNK